LPSMHPRTKAMSPVKRPSRMTSIFLLTSIFNESIHSSIAVFYLDRIHEQWKGRIETWQQRKRVVRKRRAARKNSRPFGHKDRGRASVPFVFAVTAGQRANCACLGRSCGRCGLYGQHLGEGFFLLSRAKRFLLVFKKVLLFGAIAGQA